MKTKFELKNWLTENRDTVIASYTRLTKEELFNNISLKTFMTETFNSMVRNNIKSSNRASKMLSILITDVYNDNLKVAVTYSKPYSESNHAKQVNYFGAEKTNQLNNLH
tara:strand:- start:58 stop:384 length:327 start_codon:yes stop_codon:yes gene_type:complete